MTIRFLSIILLFSIVAFSCSNSNEEQETESVQTEIDTSLSLSDQIDQYIDQNRYDEALELLESEDREDPDIRVLLEKTHLNYGLNNMNTFDQSEMRTRMNGALTQFTEVLKLNPDNQVAREQIEQIMMVYATMPDRQPEEHVLEGLRELGFDY